MKKFKSVVCMFMVATGFIFVGSNASEAVEPLGHTVPGGAAKAIELSGYDAPGVTSDEPVESDGHTVPGGA